MCGIMKKLCASVLAAIGVATLYCQPIAAISIGVSPPRFELNIGQKKQVTQSFKVLNNGKKPATFKIYTQGWTLNEKNQVQSVASTEQSLDRWIVVNPVQFTLPPGKVQTVRFAVRPRVQPKSGEHRAFIYVEELPGPDENNNPKATVNVKVLGRFGVAVYGYVGDAKRVGVVNSITVDNKTAPVKAAFDISSQGNAYVRMKGEYAVWPASKYPGASATKPMADLGQKKISLPNGVLDAGSLPSSPVLPDTRRQVILNIAKKLPPGQYVLDINGDLNGQPIDKGIPFTVTSTTNAANTAQPSSNTLPSSQTRVVTPRKP
jgi:P pilus assembly chaperone PapD